mgnify:CR=1 FL=1
MKAMKTKMLIFVFLLGITDLFAQTLYVPGTIVKGKNASYYCSTKYEILIKLNNVNNVDTTTTMYYDDGTVVPFDEGSAVLEAKEEAYRIKNENEKELRERRNELQRNERRLLQREETLDKKIDGIEQREQQLVDQLLLAEDFLADFAPELFELRRDGLDGPPDVG